MPFNIHILPIILFFNDWDLSVLCIKAFFKLNITIFTKTHIVQDYIKPFPVPLFNHFIQPRPLHSPNKVFTWCFKRSASPIKMLPPFCSLPPHMVTLKPCTNLYAPPSLISMTTMIRQLKKIHTSSSCTQQACYPGYSVPNRQL